jgi:hypothetical protein
MSLSTNKVNTPGLSGGSFGTKKKKTGLSSQATKNLSNSTSATKSSLFSLKKGKRSNYVAGQFVTKGSSEYNYSRARARANGGVSRRSYTGSYSSSYPTLDYSTNSGLSRAEKAYLVMSTITEGLSILNQFGTSSVSSGSSVASGNSVAGSSSSNSSKLSSAVNTLSGDTGTTNLGTVSNDGVASNISSMESATDSATLRTAISSAEQELSSMNSETSSLESAANTAEQNMETYKKDVATAEDNQKTANSNLTKANNEVNIQSKEKESKLILLENANKEYGQATRAQDTAQTNFNNAKTNLATAQTTLDNTPQYITDAEGNQVENPAYKQAQKALEEAKTKYNEAESALNTANDNLTKAKENVDSSNEAVNKAKQDLDKANENLKKAQDKQKTAEEKKAQADENYEKAVEERDNAKGAIKAYKAHVKDVESLQKSITSQKERLKKLEEKEKEEYNKLNDKIIKGDSKNDQRNAKIDTSDGMNLKERWLSKKMDRTNRRNTSRLSEKESLESNVILTNMSRLTDGVRGSDGNTYKKYQHTNGQTYYTRNNQFITEEEYEAGIS